MPDTIILQNYYRALDVASHNSFEACLVEGIQTTATLHNLKIEPFPNTMPLSWKAYIQSLTARQQKYVSLFIEHQRMKVNSYFNNEGHLKVRRTGDSHYIDIFSSESFSYKRLVENMMKDLFCVQEHTCTWDKFDCLFHIFEQLHHLALAEQNRHYEVAK